MKRKAKRLLGMLLAVVMVVGMMPMTAMASDGTEIITASENVEVLEAGESDEVIVVNEAEQDTEAEAGEDVETSPILGASSTAEVWVGGVSMANNTYLANGETKTQTTKPEEGGYAYLKDGVLTLDNYQYTGTGYCDLEGDYIGIYTKGATNIVLIGENGISIDTNMGDDALYIGIYCNGNTVICGEGSVEIEAEFGILSGVGELCIKDCDISIDATSDSGHGIFVSEQNYIEENAKVTINAGGHGIFVCFGMLTVKNSENVVTKGEDGEGYAAYGDIRFEDSIITGGSIARANYGSGSLYILNSTFETTDNVSSNQTIYIDNSDVTALTLKGSYVNVADSNVTITTTEWTNSMSGYVAEGIEATNGIEARNSELIVNAGIKGNGIFVFNDCTIEIYSEGANQAGIECKALVADNCMMDITTGMTGISCGAFDLANSEIKINAPMGIVSVLYSESESHYIRNCVLDIESSDEGIDADYIEMIDCYMTIDANYNGIDANKAVLEYCEVEITAEEYCGIYVDNILLIKNSDVTIQSSATGIMALMYGSIIDIADSTVNVDATNLGISAYYGDLNIKGNSNVVATSAKSDVDDEHYYSALHVEGTFNCDEAVYEITVSENSDGTPTVAYDVAKLGDYDYIKIEPKEPAYEAYMHISEVGKPIATKSADGMIFSSFVGDNAPVQISNFYWSDSNFEKYEGEFKAKESYYATFKIISTDENIALPTDSYFDIYVDGVRLNYNSDGAVREYSEDGMECTVWVKYTCIDYISITGVKAPKMGTDDSEAVQNLNLTSSISDLSITEYRWCETLNWSDKVTGVLEGDKTYYLAIAVQGDGTIDRHVCTVDGEEPEYSKYMDSARTRKVLFVPVEAVKFESIKITEAPYRTIYATGETFESEGMVVKAVYEDGSELEVTDYTLPTGELFAGDASVTISYTLCGVTKTASQAIRVDNKALKALVIEEEAYKISYFVGETFDTEGMVVKAIYSDDSEAVISKYTVTPSGALTEADEKVTISYTVKEITHSADQPIEVAPDGLWIKDIEPVTYTGKAIKPEVEVYYGHTLLTSKDYTISYKNNTNAATADAVDGKGKSIAPTVVIKGKGNFTGSVSKTFTIEPINLSDYATDEEIQSIVSIEPVYVKHTGKAIYGTPVFKVNGKAVALKAGQYILEYPDGDLDGKTSYQDCGKWNITVKGTGRNFVGETTVTQTISAKLMSKVSITLDKSSYPYNAETGETYPATVTVKDGKTELTKDVHYTVEYLNQDKVGTATVKVTGIGEYSGIKTKTYKITGTKLSSSMVKQLEGFTYSGEENEVVNGVNYTIMNKETPLVEGVDYEVSYSGDQVKAGKFKVTFTGINAYTGSVTKTYTIAKVSAATLRVELHNAERVKYAKGGATPKPEVYFGDELLTEGVDYKISYSNNKKLATSGDAKAPGLYITGIGNFTGNTKSTPVKFTIVQADLGEYTVLDVTDVLYKDAKGNYVPKFTLKDLTTGKALAKKTDYSATYSYEIFDESSQSYVPFDGEKVAAPESRTKMRITVTGAGCYKGSIEGTYEIYRMNIASVKVGKIPSQVYTSRAIEPELDITVKEGKVYVPLSAENYDIVYVNNVNKGTATAYIYGKGAYGGEKKVTFKITSQKMTWWESLFS